MCAKGCSQYAKSYKKKPTETTSKELRPYEGEI